MTDLPVRARRALRAALLAACLLLPGAAFAQHAFEWNPRTGDAWIDAQLADINAYGSRYRGAFVDELVRYRAAPRELVLELIDERSWAPGDVYYACALAQVLGRPCRALVDAWGQSHADGWAAVAGQAGIDSRPEAAARLKQAITGSYARWGRPQAEVVERADEDAPAPGAKTGKASKPSG